MGVQGLWELLAPVGRRVSVEALAGKKLAIDASIWMVQFTKAMRDEKGEMVRNAHILGFFRRICKLLFLRTRPVFVFDGGTPALKRRTVAARRRHRENARAKIRKTAEKLLLNHLKAKRLEELAAEIKNSKPAYDSKGKQIMDDSELKHVARDDQGGLPGSSFGYNSKEYDGVLNQENLDELLAASLAAEEEQRFTGNELETGGSNLSKGEADVDENEEMIYPLMSGNIDPTVLASLPPSMQLDLLVQMREGLMAENRQKYQKLKKAPSKFSQLQIQSYLKTVAFRREIDEVQKCAVRRGLEGMQTSRIASEADKEFIFSSSFAGDKQKLMTAGVGKNGGMNHDALNSESSLNAANHNSSRSNYATGASCGVSVKEFGHDVEKFCNERGHVRVSRVRGLGIRMTRDLQRNLDLMKEYEQEKSRENTCIIPDPIHTEVHGASKLFSEANFSSHASISDEENQNTISESTGRSAQHDGRDHFDQPSTVESKAAIEITFLEDESERTDIDDSMFLHLVSGSSSNQPFISFDTNKNDSESDCIWEEGVVEEDTRTWTNDVDKKSHLALAARIHLNDDEADLEEDIHYAPEAAFESQDKLGKAVSIGLLEEEADIQEALRRSLGEFERMQYSAVSSDDPNQKLEERILFQSPKNSINQKNVVSTHVPLDKVAEYSGSSCIKVDGLGQLEDCSRQDTLQTTDYSKYHLSSPVVSGYCVEGESSLNDEPNEGLLVSSHNHKTQSAVDDGSLGASYTSTLPSVELVEDHLEEGSMDTSNQGGDKPLVMPTKEFTEISADLSLGKAGSSLDKAPKIVLADSIHHALEPSYEDALCQKTYVVEKLVECKDEGHEHDIEKNKKIPSAGESCFRGETITEESIDRSEATLDQEILILRQEREDLRGEQRKMERNAESVTCEMFVECQELLQMFGLPYIIAPMEAEAQCAYLEMKNLVDGVVTDDSDVFLFGAQNVYKNIFDDRKYVETYLMKDIGSELGLNREKLIRMALLLGSDYTEGISGIGIVNAIEVVHAFPEEDGLHKFKEWLESPDPSILEQLDSRSCNNQKKKLSKVSNSDADKNRNDVEGSIYEGGVTRELNDQPTGDSLESKEIFMNVHRNVSKNWHIPPAFPSESVVSAYTSPEVDESTESFSWGKPDLFLLRKLCWERFGWSDQKADELLVPVLNEYDKHETQLRLEAFYSFNERFAKIRSKRIKKAVKGITGTCSSQLMMDEQVQEGGNSRINGRLSTSRPKEKKLENLSDGKTRSMNATKPSRRQKTQINDMQIEDGAVGSFTSDQRERSTESEFGADMQGRERREQGRQKGRGKRKRRKRGGEDPILDSTESAKACSGGDWNSADDVEKLEKVPKDESKLHKLIQQHKTIKYAEENVDGDGLCCSSTPIDGATSGGAAVEQEPAKTWGKGMIGNASSLEHDGSENPLEESYSRGYLLSGGGFCLEESEDQGDTSKPVAGSTSVLVEHFTDTADVASNHGQYSTAVSEEPNQEDARVLAGGACIELGAAKNEGNPGLRAMPSLKRKRKKAW